MNDKIYKTILFLVAAIIPLVCGGIIYALVTDAYEAFEHFGFFRFLTSKEWSYTEGAEQYGALPFITGTLMTTLASHRKAALSYDGLSTSQYQQYLY